MVSFFSGGEIYVMINEKHYKGGAVKRDKLISESKELQVLDQDLDRQEVVSGRNLVKRLFELSEGELEKLLNIFRKYCG
jgi:hypothetical protein